MLPCATPRDFKKRTAMRWLAGSSSTTTTLSLENSQSHFVVDERGSVGFDDDGVELCHNKQPQHIEVNKVITQECCHCTCGSQTTGIVTVVRLGSIAGCTRLK
jgi:hypothetical protein